MLLTRSPKKTASIDVAESAENKVKTNQDTLNSVRAQQQTEPQ